MLKSKLAAIGWGSRESLPSPSSWVLALILGALLLLGVVVALAFTPVSLYVQGGSPAPHPTGNTILEGFLSSPGHLLIVLVPASLAIWVSRLERGLEDRHDPLILLAVVLGALGFATTAMGAQAAERHFGEWRPFGLLTLSVLAFAASALLSLVRLVILRIKRSPRRGRVFALFLLVWSVWFGGLLYAFVLVPRDPPPAYRDGIELAAVNEGMLGRYTYLSVPRELWPRETVRVHANGDIEWEGERLGTDPAPDGGDGYQYVLSAMVSRMSKTDVLRGELPDEALYVRADRRAPAAVVSRIITGCQGEGVGIWKVIFQVELSRVQEGLPNWGYIHTYLPRIAPQLVPEGVVAEVPLVIEIGAVEGAGGDLQPVFHYQGEQWSGAAELVEGVLERHPKSGTLKPLIRVDPRLSWGPVATTLSELLLLDSSHGDKSLNLLGLEVLED